MIERPKYAFGVAQHGSGRECTLNIETVLHVGAYMANLWAKESCG